MEKKDLLANYAASKQNMCITNDTISDRLFQEYRVNRGLRDVNGKGVLTGLTRISKIVSFKDENGKQVPCDGELWYRGYNVNSQLTQLNLCSIGKEIPDIIHIALMLFEVIDILITPYLLADCLVQ